MKSAVVQERESPAGARLVPLTEVQVLGAMAALPLAALMTETTEAWSLARYCAPPISASALSWSKVPDLQGFPKMPG
jgi:hypothetical protein